MIFLSALAMVAMIIGPAFAGIEPADYLFEFGYLEERNPTTEKMTAGIIKFQTFSGLPITGELDNQTIQLMNTPRCGEKDILKPSFPRQPLTTRSLPAYNLVGIWPKQIITWKIESYSKTSSLSKYLQRRAIIRGINRWSKVTPLEFKEVTGEADVTIGFELNAYHGYRHGPFSPFSLAHAFFPPRPGSIHFWDVRNWIIGNNDGYDLETVAAHEMGHALGLNHSSHETAVMYGPYMARTHDYKLGSDDIAGIQALYGKHSAKEFTRTTKRISPGNIPYPSPTGKGFCNHDYKRIDAAMRINEKDFVFVDNGSVVIDGRNGHKMATSDLFPNGPYSVHAAVFSVAANRVYLFKDEQLWAYLLNSNGLFVLVNYFPKYLSKNFGKNIEAAMRMDNHGREDIILIKDKHWQYFDPYSELEHPAWGYPTDFSFRNIPLRIDAVISSDEYIHFIVEDKAYRMRIGYGVVETHATPINSAFKKCRS